MAFFSGLAARFRNMLDPNRLAMSQALLAGDDGATAQMAQRFRQLQAEHERLRMWDRKKRNAHAAFYSDGYASLESSLKPNPGLDSVPMPRGQFEPGGGAGSAEGFFNSVGQGTGRGIHAALQSGTGPSPVFGPSAGDAARTRGFDDEQGVDDGVGDPDFAETLPRARDGMTFPLAALNLPQESGPKLRAKRPAPNARSGEFRGSGQLGVSAQAREPTLVDAITEPVIQQARNMGRNLMPPGADGRIGNAYSDPDYLPIEAALEREYRLPPGILSRIRMRGERSNANEVSRDGARTVYQIIPSTRDLFMRAYGVDAWRGPADAARVAALHLVESHRNHGDWNRAILEYHGSPNPRNWGRRTRAYGRRVGDVNGRR